MAPFTGYRDRRRTRPGRVLADMHEALAMYPAVLFPMEALSTRASCCQQFAGRGLTFVRIRGRVSIAATKLIHSREHGSPSAGVVISL